MDRHQVYGNEVFYSGTGMHSFDSNKRRTLKAAAGLTTAGIVGSFSGAASAFTAILHDAEKPLSAHVLHCKLISQPGIARAYLLVDNPSRTPIALTAFRSEILHFGGTTVNLADAFTSPTLLLPQQNAMLSIYLEPDLNSHPVADRAHYADNYTRYLGEGTRVVSFSALVENKVASIADPVVSQIT